MKQERRVARPGEAERFEVGEKLIVYRFLDKDKRLICTYDDAQHYCLGSSYVILKGSSVDLELIFILAMLNSRLTAFYNNCLFEGVKITLTEMGRLPIFAIDFSSPTDLKLHDQVVSLVTHMLTLHEQLSSAKTPPEKQLLQRQIDTTDSQIDALVYELYGLTDDEIRIVEDG
jgi:hypothetical protein